MPRPIRHTTIALQTGDAKVWMLLVGVSHYHDPRIPSLQYAAIDCQSLADALTEATQPFPEATIEVHHDSAVMAPTLSSVRAGLQEIVDRAQPQDTVLFYFCGHSALEPRLQQVVLCLADTEKDALLKTGFSVMSLLGLLSACPARQQILWLDSNHSKTSFQVANTTEAIDNPSLQLYEMLRQRAIQNPGFYALLSCDRGQQSWADPELGHGIFTYFLIQGLQGKAADAQGVISAEALSAYVYDQSRQYFEQIHQPLRSDQRQDVSALRVRPRLQTPKKIAKGQESFILGVKQLQPVIIPQAEVPTIAEIQSAPPVTEARLERSQPEQPAPKISDIQPLPFVQSVEVSAQPPTTEHLEQTLPKVEELRQEPALLERPEVDVPVPPSFDEPEQDPQRAKRIRRVVARRIQRGATQRLRQVAVSIEAFKQAAQQFVSSQQAAYQQSNRQIRTLSAEKLYELKRSTRKAKKRANQRVHTSASQVTPLMLSAAEKASEFSRSVQDALNHALSETRDPQTRKIMTVAIAGLGLSAVGLAGLLLYQQRNERIRDIHELSTTSEALLSSNRSPEALLAALRAGRQLQHVDRPWNAVPQSVKMNAIATLQQAIASAQTRDRLNPKSKVSAISASLDGKTFAIAIANNTIQLWQREGDQLKRSRITFSGHSAAITQLRFSPDGRFLASASRDKTIKLWNVEKGILVKTLTGHTRPVTALGFRFDGAVLASGSADQTIKLWTIPAGALIETLKGHAADVSAIRFSADGGILASGGTDNTIRLWYPDSNKPILLGRHEGAITDLAFSPDGGTIASASLDKTIKLWTVSDAKPEREANSRQTLVGHYSGVTSLSFDSTGQVLASGSQDTTIKLWDLATATVFKTLVGHQDSVENISFSADGRALMSVSDRNGLIRWNLDLDNLLEQGCQQVREAANTTLILHNTREVCP